MPRAKNPVPTYRHHKGSGQAFVVLAGRKPVYLGKYGSPESKAAYAKLVADLKKAQEAGTPLPIKPIRQTAGGTVASIARAFLERHLEGYSESESAYYRTAVGLLVSAAGDDDPAAFGPLALTRLRDVMVGKGWTREHVNAQVRRVRSIFRWGESVELVPAGKWFQLRSVPGLKSGRTTAPNQRKKRAVTDAVIEKTLPHLSPSVAAMVRFQRLTGCRPQDVCRLNFAEIDRTGEVWLFRPDKHKNDWRGQTRVVYIGPQAQAILAPFIAGREHAPAVFSPRVAWDERRAGGAKGKRWAGYVRKGPPANVGELFDTQAYLRAIKRGCGRANTAAKTPEDRIKVWTANMIRHRVGTDVREKHGLEAAQKLLGHKHAATTEHYAAPTDAAAERVAAAEG